MSASPSKSAIANSVAKYAAPIGTDPTENIGRLIDVAILFASTLAIGIFFVIMMSPALATVRRTYMELGTAGRLACACLFITGLLLLMLCLFWAFVHASVAWRTRSDKMELRVRSAVAPSLVRAQREAFGLQQNLVADLRRNGASDLELAQVRALIDSVSRKVALESKRQIAEYENNPAVLAQDVRATAERLERGEVLDGGFKRAA